MVFRSLVWDDDLKQLKKDIEVIIQRCSNQRKAAEAAVRELPPDESNEQWQIIRIAANRSMAKEIAELIANYKYRV
jgi:hypothetical protein